MAADAARGQEAEAGLDAVVGAALGAAAEVVSEVEMILVQKTPDIGNQKPQDNKP